MNRRIFLGRAIAAAGALALGTTSRGQSASAAPRRRFKLRYAPHFGMFASHAGEDLVDQLRFIADQGFTAVEDNQLRRRTLDDQQEIGNEIGRLGLDFGQFIATSDVRNTTFVLNSDDVRNRLTYDMRNTIDVARRVNAKWVVIVPGLADRRIPIEFQSANVIDNLKRCADMLEPAGIGILIKPLNAAVDFPGVFLQNVQQAFIISRAVNRAGVKVLFDIYNQQVSSGNIIGTINDAWSEIAYFQSGDSPGRKEPGTGELNFRTIFRHIHSLGFKGIVGMDHGNSRGGRAGEQGVIDSYLIADNF